MQTRFLLRSSIPRNQNRHILTFYQEDARLAISLMLLQHQGEKYIVALLRYVQKFRSSVREQNLWNGTSFHTPLAQIRIWRNAIEATIEGRRKRESSGSGNAQTFAFNRSGTCQTA